MGFHRLANSSICVDLSSAPEIKNFVGGFPRFVVEGSLSNLQPASNGVVRFGGWDMHTLFLASAQSKGGGGDPTGLLFGNDGSKSLPKSCIESAEHVVRCKSLGLYETWSPKRSTMKDPPRPYVTALFGDKRVNISTQDLEDKTLLPYGNYFRYADITVADGIILAYSQNEDRPQGIWSCHAVAVVAKEVNGQALIIIDIYANDSAKKTALINDWTMSYVTSMSAFSAHYCGCVGGDSRSSMGRLIPTG
ncbi:MAG: hypothetical protein WBE72_11325 [Terracidiphilus sp.]